VATSQRVAVSLSTLRFPLVDVGRDGPSWRGCARRRAGADLPL